MACYTMRRTRQQTEEERRAEIEEALTKLERGLMAGEVTVEISYDGAICFVGWEDRNDVADVCAFETLSQRDSLALQQAVEAAQSISGFEVNREKVAAGIHSHDGGKTWSSH